MGITACEELYLHLELIWGQEPKVELISYWDVALGEEVNAFCRWREGVKCGGRVQR